MRPRLVVTGAALLALMLVLGAAFFSALRTNRLKVSAVVDAPAVETPSATAPPPRPSTAPADGPPPTARPARAVVAPRRPLNEGELMARLRELRDSDPAAAIELARAGNQRFPDSADAPERSSILVHALAARGETSAARGEAERMVNHYPDSEWVREVEQFSGAHRHRNLRLNDAGQLEYQ